VKRGQPKIAEISVAIFVEQDVAWFQVAVDHAPVMHVAEAAGDLREQIHRIVKRQHAAVQRVRQRPVTEQAHGEISEFAFQHAVTIDREDVDMFEHGDDFGFA